MFRPAAESFTTIVDEVFPKFNIPPIKLSYDQTRPPYRNVFMNIPIAVKPMVEKRLEQLLTAGIIERVTDDMDDSFSSSMLAIPKGKDDIRLVIDLRGPNSYIQRSPFKIPCLEKILAELDGAQWFSTIDMSISSSTRKAAISRISVQNSEGSGVSGYLLDYVTHRTFSKKCYRGKSL